MLVQYQETLGVAPSGKLQKATQIMEKVGTHSVGGGRQNGNDGEFEGGLAGDGENENSEQVGQSLYNIYSTLLFALL